MSYEVIANPTFQPAMKIITSITNAYPAAVAIGEINYPGDVETITASDHQYVDGMIVRLFIPRSYGMTQVHLKYGVITITGDSTFTIDIDTTNYDPFIIPDPILIKGGSVALKQYAQAVPFAEIADILTAAVRNVLPY